MSDDLAAPLSTLLLCLMAAVCGYAVGRARCRRVVVAVVVRCEDRVREYTNAN